MNLSNIKGLIVFHGAPTEEKFIIPDNVTLVTVTSQNGKMSDNILNPGSSILRTIDAILENDISYILPYTINIYKPGAIISNTPLYINNDSSNGIIEIDNRIGIITTPIRNLEPYSSLNYRIVTLKSEVNLSKLFINHNKNIISLDKMIKLFENNICTNLKDITNMISVSGGGTFVTAICHIG